MKHPRFLLTLVAFWGIFSDVYGQNGYVITEDKPFQMTRIIDTAVMGPIKRGTRGLSVSNQELEFIYWVNKMRCDPGEFHQTYIVPYLQQFPEAISEESRSLSEELAVLAPIPPLVPSKPLFLAAGIHASFLVRAGRLSHNGEGGKEFGSRMEEQGIKTCAGEVLFEGKEDMLVAVILLLIDHRVQNLGHRRALLSPAFVRTGVGIRRSPTSRVIVVEDLACN